MTGQLLALLNKAGYTATEVACGWAGAIFEVTRPFGQEQWGQKNKILKKSEVWPTKRPTDRPTDQSTDKAGCRIAWSGIQRCFMSSFSTTCMRQDCDLTIDQVYSSFDDFVQTLHEWMDRWIDGRINKWRDFLSMRCVDTSENMLGSVHHFHTK